MDNDITLSLGLDAEDVKQRADTISEQLIQAFDSIGNKELSGPVDSLMISMDRTISEISKLAGKIREFDGEAEAFVGLKNKVESLNKELVEAKELADTFSSTLAVIKKDADSEGMALTKPYASLVEQYEELEQSYNSIIAKQRQYEAEVDSLGASQQEDLLNALIMYQEIEATIENFTNTLQNPDLNEADIVKQLGMSSVDAVMHIRTLKQYLLDIVELMDGIKQESGLTDFVHTEDVITASKDLEDLSSQLTELEQKMQAMEGEGRAFIKIEDTEAYKSAANGLKQAQDAINEKQKELSATQTEINQKIKDGTQYRKGEESAAYDELIQKQNQMINNGAKQLHQLDKMQESSSKLGDIFSKSFGNSIVDFANNIKQLPQMLEGALDDMARMLPPWAQAVYSAVKLVLKFVIDEAISAAKQVASVIKNYAVKALNAATSAAKAFAKALLEAASNAILSPFKKIGDAIANIRKNAEKSTPTLKQIGRAFLQYGIGARSLYRLINKLRTALFQGFENLALSFEPFNDAMSRISTSLEYLKNSFAAAFAPIIQAVAPALSLLINKVAEAVQWIGQLIALLTGQQFVMAQPVYKDYAANTSAGAAAAKQAAKNEKDRAKALKKTAKEMRTIAGFDDVEILKAPDDSGSGSGAGGGGGGAGGAGYSFVPGNVNEGLQKFADLIKKAWETGNAYDLGKLFGKKLGDLLRAFNKKVPAIQKVTKKIADILATFLAGFLSVNDTFKELGLAIANVINTVFITIDEFLKKFIEYEGFKNLGKDIYLVIINALRNIDWETIYGVFGNLGKGIAQVLNETLAKPDLWEEIFIALTNFLKASFIRIIAFAKELHWGDIGSSLVSGVIAGIQNFPLEEAVRAVQAVLNGIWQLFINFVNEMEGHWGEIGTTAAQFIIRIFDDFNPEEFAKGVISFLDGLWEAFMAFVETPGWDQVVEKIKTAIVTFAENFQWEGKIDGLVTFLNNAISALCDVIDRLHIPELLNSIYDELRNSEEFQQLCDKIVDLFIEWLKIKIQAKLALFTGIGDAIIRFISGGQIKSLDELMPQVAEYQYDAIRRDIENENSKFEKIGAQNITEPIAEGAKNETSTVTDAMNGITDASIKSLSSGDYKGTAADNMQDFNNGINSMQSTIEGSVETLSDGINKLLDTKDKTVLIGAENARSYDRGLRGIRSDIHGTVREIADNDVIDTLNSIDGYTPGERATSYYDNGLNSNRGRIISTADNIKTETYNALNSGDWYSIGDNIINGIWHGIRNGWNWLYNKVWNLAVDLYNAACRALGIHSPSKVFADKIGEMIPAGISVGVENNENTATKSVEDMANNLVNTAKNIKMPPIAMGEVIPNSIGDTAQQTQVTLQSLLDLLQSLQDNMITQEDLNEAVATAISNFPVNFYVGDEQIARHANAGNKQLERRFGTA